MLIYVYMSTSIHIYECIRIMLNATVYCIYEQRNVALLDAFECIACTCDAYYIDKLCLFAWLILYGCACERMRMHYRTVLCLRALDARVYAQRLQVCEQGARHPNITLRLSSIVASRKQRNNNYILSAIT